MQDRQNCSYPIIGRAQPGDIADVLDLYSDCGYSGSVDPDNIILVARIDGILTGAVRVCLEHATLVLRGMQVRAEYRGRGIGKRLLAFAIPHLDRAVCYCLPYSHLVGFYASAGFQLVDGRSLPKFLRARLHGYLAEGQDLVPMRREPHGMVGISET